MLNKRRRAANQAVGGSLTLSFISSVTVDATTITMPTVQTGDFVLLVDLPAKGNSGSTQEDPVTISGLTFTALTQFTTSTDTGGATRNVIYSWAWGRIVQNGASESGTVLTGSKLSISAGRRRKTLLVFRGSSPLSTFGSPESESKVWSTGDPAATSSAMSAGTAPFIAIATYRGEGSLRTLSFSTTADGTVDNGTTSRVAYKIHNAASSDTLAADMGDSGSSNIITSFLVELS